MSRVLVDSNVILDIFLNDPIPDFFIGAHAAVLNLDLITRDVARYQTYFPTVNLITPQ